MCGTTNPSSSSEPTSSRCRAPRRRRRRSPAGPAPVRPRPARWPRPAVPCEKLGELVGASGYIRQSRPASVGSATRSSASPPVATISRLCSPPAHSAPSTTPAVPVTMSVSGAVDPGAGPRGRPSRPASSARRAGAGRPARSPGASSRSAIASPASPSYSDGSTRSAAMPRAGRRSRRERLLRLAQRAGQPDLGQHRRQAGDPAYSESRSSAGSAASRRPAPTRAATGRRPRGPAPAPRTRRPRRAPGRPRSGTRPRLGRCAAAGRVSAPLDAGPKRRTCPNSRELTAVEAPLITRA